VVTAEETRPEERFKTEILLHLNCIRGKKKKIQGPLQITVVRRPSLGRTLILVWHVTRLRYLLAADPVRRAVLFFVRPLAFLK